MRIAIVARDQSLRIASAVTRARDFADDIVVLDLSDDGGETRALAEAAGANVIPMVGFIDATDIARRLGELAEHETTVIIKLDAGWKLRDLPRTVGLARQGHDLYLAFKHREEPVPGIAENRESSLASGDYAYGSTEIQFACASARGLAAVASQSAESRPSHLPDEIDLRVVELARPPGPPQRESLATASRFAQFFYWMMESRHPLLLFGIPGIIFFLLGFEMAQSLIDIGGPHDPVSLGVALAAFAATLVGVFSLTASLILYVLGKQVDKLAFTD